MDVFIAGTGTMGAGIAQVFARSGHKVRLYDINKELVDKGFAGIEGALSKLVAKGSIAERQKEETLGNIKPTVDLKDAAGCSLALEAIVENIGIKKEFFLKLEEICGEDTVFATNTSSLSITEMAACLKRKGRLVGMHFFNPAPVMKLVEVIRGIATSDETFETVRDIALAIGKEPVEVKEAPGFVVNRILIPMINEAIGVLAEGIASAEDIDKAMKLGANHPIGPLALADLVGNDVCLAIMQRLYDETGDPKFRPHLELKKMVRAGYLGRKTKKGFFDY
jgi:3-hydroxybutyryl-CoA dehydrogenase